MKWPSETNGSRRGRYSLSDGPGYVPHGSAPRGRELRGRGLPNFGNFRKPHLRVSDVAVKEGNAGQTQVDVTVHLTKSFGADVVIDYSTEDGTATVANGDYVAADSSFNYGVHDQPLPLWSSQPIGELHPRVTYAGAPDVNLVAPGALVMAPNDDLSTTLLPLGFTFEFYGNNYTDFYINNNGNITFDAPLYQYTATGFPMVSFPQTSIVAPFWADVDTRPDWQTGAPGGEVRLASGTTSSGNAFIQVDWIDTGYFAAHTDKRNTFTLYVEDDPFGDIVAFVYHDMQWTSGDVSGGVNGFGGSGAQVGFDSGDGVNYVSLIRPNDQAGVDFLNNLGRYVFRIDPNTGTIQEDDPEEVTYSYDTDENYAVWESVVGYDREILLYNADTDSTIQLTNNDTDDIQPRIHGSNVVWVGHDGDSGHENDKEIYYYDINTGITTQLTQSEYAVGGPEVSDTHVTWWGDTATDREIFLYDISTGVTETISSKINDHGGLDDYDPRISGSTVVWSGYDGKDFEIYVYDNATDQITEVTTNTTRDGWAQIDGDNVVWRGYDGTDYEVYLYQIGSGITTQLTDNTQDDNAPQVSGVNVVWQGYDGVAPGDRGDWDIFGYSLATGLTTNVSSNAYLDDSFPQIQGNQVVWESKHLGDNWEVMHTEFGSGAIPQNISGDFDSQDRYPLLSDEMVIWRGLDGQVYELMMATQAEPEVTETIQLTVNGDIDLEADEWFLLNLSGASVVGLPGGVNTVIIDDSKAEVKILNDDSGMDFGDAPAPYATLAADDGARHLISPGLTLGIKADPELDGQPAFDAQGDDNDLLGDDEDGLVGLGILAPGHKTTFEIQVTGQGYLTAWIDYNQDGVWADYTDSLGNVISETIISTDAMLDTGTHQFDVIVPDSLRPMTTFVRLRYSSDPDAVALPTGFAPDGEVEDYRVQIEVGNASISGWKFNDLDRDGVWNVQGSTVPLPPITLQPFGSGSTVLMSGRDSDGQSYADVGPNDDLSSDALPLGFSFELFGETYTQFYINNNGNITFENPLGRFVPEGFPTVSPQITPIVAPFWADVDTRAGSAGTAGGEVKMSTGTSVRGNPFVQVDWVDVGYFDRTAANNNDARNAFSLYIEDNPVGDIVVFNYNAMEWTTGGVTGTGGFGGLGAQIGFDAGDGSNFVSLMRPDSQETLADLLQIEQFAFRIDPVSGTPVAAEPGLAGVTVFLDLNGDGQLGLDADGLPEPSTVTMEDDPATLGIDETGYYEFTELFPGTYNVLEILSEPEWIQTFPNEAFPGEKVYLPEGMREIRIPAGSQITDEMAFTVSDGSNTVTFEFDDDGATAAAGAVAVPFDQGDAASGIAAAVAEAVNQTPGLDVSANREGDVVTLIAGPTAIVDFHPGNTAVESVSSFSSVDNGAGYYTVVLDSSENFRDAVFGNFQIPHLSVSDVTVVEGNSGETVVDVTVHVSKSFGSTITVDYLTNDDTRRGPRRLPAGRSIRSILSIVHHRSAKGTAWRVGHRRARLRQHPGAARFFFLCRSQYLPNGIVYHRRFGRTGRNRGHSRAG